MKTLFVKYSNERNKKYKIKTELVKDGDIKYIKKSPICDDALKHIKKMYESFEILSGMYQNSKIKINKAYSKDGFVLFDYINGYTFESVLDGYLEKEDYKGLFDKILEFEKLICDSDKIEKFEISEKFINVFGNIEFEKEYYAFSYSNLDLVFSNVLINDFYNIVDYEWCFDFPIPIKYILFRAIDTYICLQKNRQVLREKDIFAFLGYSEKEINIFKKMEESFQKFVYEDSFSSNELYENLHGNVINVFEKEVDKKIPIRVYYDKGNGYSDKDGFVTYRKPYEKIKLKIEVSGAKVVRVDTGCVSSIVTLFDYFYVTSKGIERAIYSTNGIEIEKNIVAFTDNDTQIYLYGFEDDIKYVQLEFLVNPADESYIKSLANIGKNRVIAEKELERLKLEYDELSREYQNLNNINLENIKALEEEKNENKKILNMYEDCRNQCDSYKNQYENYKYMYEMILNSDFWKMTKPFRKLVEVSKVTMKKLYKVLRKPKTLVRCLKEYGVKETIEIFKQTYNIGQKKASEFTEKLEQEEVKENVLNESLNVDLIDRECRLKVSVIVPNYNHKEYLKERLDSIYNQTYKNFEVILLDDCSSDGSRELLAEYAEKHKDNTIFAPNEKNSGGVFRQWAKGIEMAKGDICWIAESDDFCDNDFLENLVYYFNDESVMIAYAHYTFWLNGKPSNFAFENYLGEVGTKRWEREYVVSAYDEVQSGLGIKNVIPNASGCIFRKPINMPLLKDENWLKMRICGDWVFYLKQIVGGKIAYNPKANSYFRFHDDSASKVTHNKEVYYKEHKMVADTIAENYRDSEDIIKKNRDIIYRYYFDTMENPTEEDFERLYGLKDVKEKIEKRKKTILISIYAFSLGGGEIFPIRLANELKSVGENVSVHIFEKEQCDKSVRDMLSKDIPVFYGKTADEFTKIIEENKFDVINTHHQSIQHMVAEAYIKHKDVFDNCKHIATMHGMYEQLPKAYIMQNLKVIDDSVDVWTRVADKNLAPFYTAGIFDEKKHIFIPNGIKVPEKVDIKRKDLNIPEDAFVLGLASRALKEKGWIEAIEAVKEAREISKKDIHIIMMGNGPMYDELLEKKVPSFVHLIGFVKDSCNYYNICDMCFLPSYYSGESFPLTVIEALCVGKPVISSIIGETPRILNCDNGECAGKLFELENNQVPIEKVAKIIAEFASNKELYEKARNNARYKMNDFTISTVSKIYNDVYSNFRK